MGKLKQILAYYIHEISFVGSVIYMHFYLFMHIYIYLLRIEHDLYFS